MGSSDLPIVVPTAMKWPYLPMFIEDWALEVSGVDLVVTLTLVATAQSLVIILLLVQACRCQRHHKFNEQLLDMVTEEARRQQAASVVPTPPPAVSAVGCPHELYICLLYTSPSPRDRG